MEKKKDENGEDLRLTVVTTPPPFDKRSGAITTDSPKVKALVESMDSTLAANRRKDLAKTADELKKMGVKINEK